MTQTTLPFDICANKHRGNRNSFKAYESGKVTHDCMRERIRIFIAGCGFFGVTSKEIGKHFGKELNTFSGRITQLKAKQEVFESGRQREGAEVLVVRREWING